MVFRFCVVALFKFNFPRDFSTSRRKKTGARWPPRTLEMATEDNATKTKQLRASAGGCAEINGEFKHLGGQWLCTTSAAGGCVAVSN